MSLESTGLNIKFTNIHKQGLLIRLKLRIHTSLCMKLGSTLYVEKTNFAF